MKMNLFAKPWFWVFILGIITAIAAIIIYSFEKNNEWWVWLILVIGLVVAIGSAIWGTVVSDEHMGDPFYTYTPVPNGVSVPVGIGAPVHTEGLKVSENLLRQGVPHPTPSPPIPIPTSLSTASAMPSSAIPSSTSLIPSSTISSSSPPVIIRGFHRIEGQ